MRRPSRTGDTTTPEDRDGSNTGSGTSGSQRPGPAHKVNKSGKGIKRNHARNAATAAPPPSSPPRAQTQAQPRRRAPQDPVTAPSSASGGIPTPTSAYLLRASFLARPVDQPRPLLVVIDLNGTMLFRPNKKNPSKFVERPCARQFLEYCITTFHVVIWSSARPENVRSMCASLISPALHGRLVAIWGRDKFGLTADDYNRRTQCYKRLTLLWDDPNVAAAHPLGEPWNQGNTVLIDDSAEKARSEPYNAITIPEFMGELRERPEVLPMVHNYLNTLAMQADLSTYVRAEPFMVHNENLRDEGFD
ncbi:HAD-like domain-containing protein [Bombardia bombarda]|uniref:Mitochondrial import inner membrane translocase subunit TIM50 n=1 Tax=Bombardia bombarda TaxID=252184 RepID=A0AA39XKM8_9PEZI|nr:HAD-like domain-containing protein [Bombardia bombarda]